jgi:diacylglycerol kinase (ATP)
VATLALRGEHLNDPLIMHFRSRHIKVTTEDHVQLNLDGEYGGTLPCTFTALKGHLEIFVDEQGIASYRKRLIAGTQL